MHIDFGARDLNQIKLVTHLLRMSLLCMYLGFLVGEMDVAIATFNPWQGIVRHN